MSARRITISFILIGMLIVALIVGIPIPARFVDFCPSGIVTSSKIRLLTKGIALRVEAKLRDRGSLASCVSSELKAYKLSVGPKLRNLRLQKVWFSSGKVQFTGRIQYYQNWILKVDVSFDGHATFQSSPKSLQGEIYVDVNHVPGILYKKNHSVSLTHERILNTNWARIDDIHIVGDSVSMVIVPRLF